MDTHLSEKSGHPLISDSRFQAADVGSNTDSDPDSDPDDEIMDTHLSEKSGHPLIADLDPTTETNAAKACYFLPFLAQKVLL